MESRGWISLNRKIQSHWIWLKDKPFDCRSAWIDILLLANHKNNKFPLGTEMVEVERGSFITSEIKLMERWGWSKTKVRNFLKLLENDGMITKKADRKKTTINIVNYSVYQDIETTKEPQKNHQETDSRPLKDTNNNDITMNNNDNNNTIKIVNLEDKKNNINYQQVVDMYNDICISFPRLIKLSDTRKKAIKARLKTYSLEQFKTMFTMAESSDFLKGKNDRNWSATFDWLIKDNNMVKVLEGNYSNKNDTNVKEANGSIFDEFYDTNYYEQFKGRTKSDPEKDVFK